MIKIENSIIKGRFNLIDTDKLGEDMYLHQLDAKQVKDLAISIINLLSD